MEDEDRATTVPQQNDEEMEPEENEERSTTAPPEDPPQRESSKPAPIEIDLLDSESEIQSPPVKPSPKVSPLKAIISAPKKIPARTTSNKRPVTAAMTASKPLLSKFTAAVK